MIKTGFGWKIYEIYPYPNKDNERIIELNAPEETDDDFNEKIKADFKLINLKDIQSNSNFVCWLNLLTMKPVSFQQMIHEMIAEDMLLKFATACVKLELYIKNKNEHTSIS